MDRSYYETADYIKSIIDYQPEFAIILGSGLGEIEDLVEVEKVIPYSELPNFPLSTVEGHKGNLIFGKIAGGRVVIQQGRFHIYEGYTPHKSVFGVRVMRLLGAKTLFVSNAVGAVNESYKTGDLMLIEDQINLLPNPLVGENDENLGTRFPDMTRAYDRNLIAIAESIAQKEGIRIHKGVLLSGTGPSFETPAEYRFFKIVGADVVCMSTTNEVIAARHCGFDVLGISIVTNEAYNFADDFLNSGADVIASANKAAKKMMTIFREVISY
jgi:purine-nucleoside phosphorylase